MPASVLKRDLKNLIQRNASLNFQAQNGLLSLRSWWRSVRSLDKDLKKHGDLDRSFMSSTPVRDAGTSTRGRSPRRAELLSSYEFKARSGCLIGGRGGG